jgi:hypothetical protein
MTNRKSPITEQIQQRAYALFLERGAQEGHALEDWLTAEKELSEPSDIVDPSQPSRPPSQKTRAATASPSQHSPSTASRSMREPASK